MSLFKKNAGFTLVELIVVIAILAILAGVAIPSYSGYIEKAQIAGDQQELHNLNMAFMAACAEEGESNFGRTDVSASLNAGKAAVTIGNEKIAENFAVFYPAADAGEFKVMTNLVYDPGTGVFLDNSDGTAQLRVYLNNSSYKNLPLTELTGDVSDLVGELADFFGASPSNREKLLGGGFDEYLTSKGMNVADLSDRELANAAAVYLTSKAAGMTDDDILYATGYMQNALYEAFVTEGEYKVPLSQSIVDTWTDYTGSNLASYAMLYATAEAVALANGGKDGDLYQSLKNVDVNNQAAVITATTSVFENVGSDALMSYLENQSQADMEAYFKALQAVNGKEDDLLADLDNENLFTENDSIQDLVGKLGA